MTRRKRDSTEDALTTIKGAYFAVFIDLEDSEKIDRLAELLDCSDNEAGGIVAMRLWPLARKRAPLTGDLGCIRARRLAKICDWSGDPELLRSALLEARLLDEQDDGALVVHGWEERQRGLIESILAGDRYRENARLKKAEQRAKQKERELALKEKALELAAREARLNAEADALDAEADALDAEATADTASRDNDADVQGLSPDLSRDKSGDSPTESGAGPGTVASNVLGQSRDKKADSALQIRSDQIRSNQSRAEGVQGETPGEATPRRKPPPGSARAALDRLAELAATRPESYHPVGDLDPRTHAALLSAFGGWGQFHRLESGQREARFPRFRAAWISAREAVT